MQTCTECKRNNLCYKFRRMDRKIDWLVEIMGESSRPLSRREMSVLATHPTVQSTMEHYLEQNITKDLKKDLFEKMADLCAHFEKGE